MEIKLKVRSDCPVETFRHKQPSDTVVFVSFIPVMV